MDAVKILKDKIERFIPTVISYIDFKNFFVNEVLPIPVFSKNAKHSTKKRIYGNFDEFNKKKEEWLEYAGKYIEEFLKKNPLLEDDLKVKKVGNKISDIDLKVDFFIDFLDYSQLEINNEISGLKEKFVFALNCIRDNLI